MFKCGTIKEGKKKMIACMLAAALAVTGFALSGTACESQADSAGSSTQYVLYQDDEALTAMVDDVSSIKEYKAYTDGEYQEVKLNGDSVEFSGTGATVNGSDILISEAGTYVFSGTLNDGAIIVDSEEEENVVIVLNGADIICNDGAPIYVKNCGKNVVLSLVPGTENSVTDGAAYTYEYAQTTTDSETGEESTQPSGAIFSKADLRINGSGKLTVKANCNDGIVTKDDLEIAEATIVIDAADDGIVGKDSVAVKSGSITVTSGGDGIKSTNDENEEKGYVVIAEGSFKINSGADGIQAETVLMTLGGNFDITTGEGASAAVNRGREGFMPGALTGTVNGGQQGRMPQQNLQGGQNQTGGMQMMPQMPQMAQGQQTAGTVSSAAMTNNAEAATASDDSDMKALKAGTKLLVQDGDFNINSQDDALHSDGYLATAYGNYTIAAGDDAIHAENSLDIYDGTFKITQSYEGIEAANITIAGGDIDLKASDDGINASADSGQASLTIKGGKMNVDAAGDGIDVNGSATMTGGTVAVSGSTDNGNSALDYDGNFEVKGGTLLAVGSSGMAQAPNDGTTVYTVSTPVNTQQAGTEVSLVDSAGNVVFSFTAEKQFSHIILSSDVIKEGGTYSIKAGTTELATFTANDVVTNLGGAGQMFGPGRQMNRPAGGGTQQNG
ncbi:MAG: carbohydrate-binding domain-containing protein [Clostridia bacterium]|nr:carbohydrate-binding domain-containing protein [Clostridia bacterium]